MSLGLMDKTFLLPLIMVGSFVIILFFGKRLPEKATAAIGIAAVTVCFVLACIIGVQWINRVNNPPTGAAEEAAKVQCEGGPADSQTPASTEAGGAAGATEGAVARAGLVPG